MKTAMCIVLTVCISATAWAQSVSGSQISGVVKDAAGAVLPGAEVRVTQTDTGMKRSVLTDGNGFYTIPSLPIGPYRMEVSAKGFNKYVSGITLLVSSNPSINVELQVGSLSQEVQVQANASVLESQSTGVGQVIENQRILELPLNGRQATEMILLTAGALPAPPAAFQSPRNYPTLTVSVAGGSAAGLFFVMDGGVHNDPHNNLNLPIPFPDALAEFKVETSAVSAQYGYHGAGVVNLVTKSGGNSFHGSAFEFVRNGLFNAKNEFALAKDTLKRNQFGGTFGGPIMKDKLFFFGGYQGTITRSDPSESISFIPTPAMLSGDFTQFASAACNAGKAITLKGPFVNNRVNASQLDAVALKYSQFLPTTSSPCGDIHYGIPSPSSEKQAVGRGDYQRGTNHSIFGRYAFAHFDAPSFFDGKNALTTTKAAEIHVSHSFVLGDTYAFGSNRINSFRGTVNRTRNNRAPVVFVSPHDLGVKNTTLTPDYTGLIVSNAFSFGGANSNLGFWNSTMLQLTDDFDQLLGSHHLSFGGGWLYAKMNAHGDQFGNGEYSFNGQNTNLALADFLVGLPASYTQSYAQSESDRMHHVALYIQDAWKATQRLQINYGLRWEPWRPMGEATGRVSRFDLAGFQQGTKSTVYPNAPAGLTFPGDPGFPGKSTTTGKINQFAPRIGLVFDPRGKGEEVVRAGYGIFYDIPTMYYNVRFTSAAPFGNATQINNPPFADPWKNFPGGDLFAQPFTKSSPFPQAGVYIAYPPESNPTYLQQWNLSVQKRIKKDATVTVSYVGNKTTHLWLTREINPAVFIPGSSTTSNTNQRRRLFLQDAAKGVFYANIFLNDDGGNASYNGLLISLEKRYSNSFSIFSNYTWSHCINDGEFFEAVGVVLSYQDPDNRRNDRGNCAADRRHLLNVSAVLRSPKFSSSWLGRLASDWQLSTIARAMSGSSFTVSSGRDNALTGTNNQRPNVVGDAKLQDPTAARWFNTAAFVPNGPGQYGTAGRGLIRGPSRFNMNTALSRNFSIHEHHSIEIRAEAFNTLNNVQLMNPNATFTSALFGKITSAEDPRILQFALKYTF
jgi:hypothetical protein